MFIFQENSCCSQTQHFRISEISLTQSTRLLYISAFVQCTWWLRSTANIFRTFLGCTIYTGYTTFMLLSSNQQVNNHTCSVLSHYLSSQADHTLLLCWTRYIIAQLFVALWWDHELEHHSQVWNLTLISHPHQGKQAHWLVIRDICNNLIDYAECTISKATGQAEICLCTLCVCVFTLLVLHWWESQATYVCLHRTHCTLPGNTALPSPCFAFMFTWHGSTTGCPSAYEPIQRVIRFLFIEQIQNHMSAIPFPNPTKNFFT